MGNGINILSNNYWIYSYKYYKLKTKSNMKKVAMILSILTLFIANSFAQDEKALDEKYGFRTAKFESLKSTFKNLVVVEPGWYKSTTENLTLGNYKLKRVAYNFYKNQLSCIVVEIDGLVNSRGILGILQSAYGKGYQSNEYIEEYNWFGEKITMSYDENSITGDATIFISCVKLQAMEDADTEKANAEAAAKL
jgi:hypothetical protein